MRPCDHYDYIWIIIFLRYELLITVAFLLFEITQTSESHSYDDIQMHARNLASNMGVDVNNDVYVTFSEPENIGTPVAPVTTSHVTKEGRPTCYASNPLGSGPGKYLRIRTGPGTSHSPNNAVQVRSIYILKIILRNIFHTSNCHRCWAFLFI